MHYLSTRNNQLKESFLNILFRGLSKDGGLFLPSEWPTISLKNLQGKSYQDVAHSIIYPYIQDDISYADLQLIINTAYESFDHKKIAPLLNIDQNKYILELFYGPTFAFKDYALQFLGSLFSYLLNQSKKKITVLGATSGDTGSAAINAFKGKNDIEVFILHPHNNVSEVQRRQMTTVEENNIHNFAIEGTFDDCQNIVKELFVDEEIQSKTSLTAINSINWIRIIAQTVYYFWSYLQLNEEKVNFIVPSGNFGNIFSARVAKYMGLPINELHIVTNENDILHRSINSGEMKILKVKQTYSPSMDIQISSNFERQLFESSRRNSNYLNELMLSFSKDKNVTIPENIVKDMQSIYKTHAVTDSEVLQTIKEFYNKYNYLSDPHTATGLNVLNKINNNIANISLACAHPAKFKNAIFDAINQEPPIPKELKNIFDKEEKMIILENNKKLVKSEILKLI